MTFKNTEFKVGLIGKGIQASLTPAMHVEEGKAQGFSYHYDLIDVQASGFEGVALCDLLAKAESDGFCGLNITHPFKQQVIACLDELSPEAQALGAVNTVVLDSQKRIGHNTDWWGFAESFVRGLPCADLEHVVQLGAGGAGAATLFAILKLGAKRVTVLDRETLRAQELAQRMQALFPNSKVEASQDVVAAMADATGLIHATPTGMDAYPGLPLDDALITAKIWVAEIVYFPLETALVRSARNKGCRVLNGGGMAVHQAVGAFEYFTGAKADSSRMLAHFYQLTGQNRSDV